MQYSIEKVDLVVKPTICLHNFWQQRNREGYCPTGFADLLSCSGSMSEVGALFLNDHNKQRGKIYPNPY